MRPCPVKHARWFSHVNGVRPTPEMRGWLADTGSLTRKLSARSRQFRVRRLRQEGGLCLADEFRALRLARRRRVREREVLLQCDGRAVVFAHTVLPLDASAADWPFFSTLGERSLGGRLFGDARVVPGPLQFARLHTCHPLARRARAAAGEAVPDEPLLARRRLYRRRRGMLLVTELFLPALHELRPLAARETAPADD